jgi:hypothetical protein
MYKMRVTDCAWLLYRPVARVYELITHTENTKLVLNMKFVIILLEEVLEILSIPVAARSKAWVCDHSLIGIVGSNPAYSMDVCLL